MKTPFSRLGKIQAISLSVFLILLICWSHVTAAAPQPAEQTVSVFYKWYLRSLAAGREPLADDRVEISKYVSTPLIREIRQRMRSDEGLDEDYFIKAQDYLEDWERTVVADKALVDGGRALVVLQLGASSESRRKLSITLAREGGLWKIQSVQLLKTAK
ncbi:DUF3828 domain-containing protein [Rugamonas rivuli]|uniref:DUF3828 domain-containing protein n=1 Tax=Rugamonas rivuli TaxID=2743358 RepID=A0A843S9M0_9BURK|nr:DUF3828 domain-containing protein [Rugamonas rivuli]MQA18824.1 DUF3828 domain-containing protein [Rugamonas rivuli]